MLLFSLKLSVGANQKKKERGVGATNIFKKEQIKEFTIIDCRRCVPTMENRTSGYLHNERFSDSNEEKCTAFKSMA